MTGEEVRLDSLVELVAECKKRYLLPFTNLNRMHIAPLATVT